MAMLQTELKLGEPDDRFEQEAERVADQVMRMPVGATVASASARAGSLQPSTQRMCDECAEEQMAPLRRMPLPETPDDRSTVPPMVHEVLSSPGRPLDTAVSQFMESRFGHDFGRVRVHTDAHAAESAKSVAAQAYTVGTNVVFDTGRFSPQTIAGRRLLAHELTHVVQQGSSLALQRYSVPSNLPCADVVSWINNNSPYKPGWAETDCNHTFHPTSLSYTWKPLEDGTVEVTVSPDSARTVGWDCQIDRPQWSPDARPKQADEAAAYRAMLTALDAHEADHEAIAKTWQGTLEARFKALAFTVIAANEEEAASKVTQEAKKVESQWEAEAQVAQDAIDPFRGAVLTCP